MNVLPRTSRGRGRGTNTDKKEKEIQFESTSEKKEVKLSEIGFVRSIPLHSDSESEKVKKTVFFFFPIS